MLQLTLDRLNGIQHIDQPIVICNEEHRFILAEQLREIKVKAKSILLEPFGRNTAPAIAISAIKALEKPAVSPMIKIQGIMAIQVPTTGIISKN